MTLVLCLDAAVGKGNAIRNPAHPDRDLCYGKKGSWVFTSRGQCWLNCVRRNLTPLKGNPPESCAAVAELRAGKSERDATCQGKTPSGIVNCPKTEIFGALFQEELVSQAEMQHELFVFRGSGSQWAMSKLD